MKKRMQQQLMKICVLVPLVLILIGAPAFAQPAESAGQELSDEDILFAIHDQLLADDVVDPRLMDVEIDEGIVTLSGTVDHLLSKDRAIRIVQSIKGVRAVIDQLNVQPVPRSDDELFRDIKQALGADPAAEAYEIGVEVANGMVTLSGTVESWAEKELVRTVVKGVQGVKGVSNMLEIDPPPARPDSEIQVEIERRLELNPYVDDSLINVGVENGNVTLSGVVGTVAEQTEAYADAWVAGVQSVNDDELSIEWWTREEQQRKRPVQIISDEKIEEAVSDAFFYDPRLTPFEISADVDNGTVALQGTVDNLKAKRAAERDARQTTGVWRVKNFINVRPDTPPSDDDIAENIRDAFDRDPLVERFEISVMVLNGNVYLRGTVDTQLEKEQAAEAASRVKGVVEVQNYLHVLEDEWTWKTDSQIKEDIESEYFWSLLVDGGDITVNVENGVATLIGVVDTWFEHDAAVNNAFEGGATSVESYLEVAGSLSDAQPEYYDRPLTYSYW